MLWKHFFSLFLALLLAGGSTLYAEVRVPSTAVDSQVYTHSRFPASAPIVAPVAIPKPGEEELVNQLQR